MEGCMLQPNSPLKFQADFTHQRVVHPGGKRAVSSELGNVMLCKSYLRAHARDYYISGIQAMNGRRVRSAVMSGGFSS